MGNPVSIRRRRSQRHGPPSRSLQAVTAIAIICNSLLATGSFTLGTGIAVGTGIVLLIAAVIEYAVLGAPGRKRVRETRRDLQAHE